MFKKEVCLVSNSFRGKNLAIIIAVVAICLLMFGGVAMAAPANLTVTAGPSGGPYIGYGCSNSEDMSYKFELSNLAMSCSCFTAATGTDITITFKEPDHQTAADFNFECAKGLSIPVKLLMTDTSGNPIGWVDTMSVPVIDDSKSEITLHIPALAMQPAGIVSQINIGDSKQDLCADNPCKPAQYCIEVNVNVCGGTTVSTSFEIKDAPSYFEGIKVNGLVDPEDLTACDTTSVSGKVYNCQFKGMNGQLVNIKIIDDCGTVVSTATATSSSGGSFLGNIALPSVVGVYSLICSVTSPCGEVVESEGTEIKTLNIIGGSATRIIWEVWDETEGDWVDVANPQTFKYNKCNKVRVCLLDSCGNGNPATNSVDRAVYVSGFLPTGNPPTVAAHFYTTCDGATGEIGQNPQIVHVTVYEGSSCSDPFYLVPLSVGNLVVSAQTFIDSLISSTFNADAVAPTAVTLESNPLVTNSAGSPRAGWPVAVAVWLDKAATDKYKTPVELLDTNNQSVDWAKWTPEFKDDYDKPGGNDGDQYINKINPAFDCVDDSVYAMYPCCDPLIPGVECPVKRSYYYHPFCTLKSHIYIYTDKVEAVDQTLRVRVTVGDMAPVTIDIGPFVSPTELVRYLAPDKWQAFSIPKPLAKPCVPLDKNTTDQGADTIGTVGDLFPKGSIVELPGDKPLILECIDGKWDFPGYGVDEGYDAALLPLLGYYVRTQQAVGPGKANWELDYVFARATSPEDMVPAVQPLISSSVGNEGWNFIGVAVSPKSPNNTLTKQGNTAARAFGTLLGYDEARLIWNPGLKQANLANFTAGATINLSEEAFASYAYDSGETVFNGDGYWLNINGTDPVNYTGNVGQDMIEWDGPSYSD